MSISDGLERASPASRGIAPAAVQAFLDAVAAEGIELHGFMAYRQGAVFAEGWWAPYAAQRPHMLHSLVKSFTATGVGLAYDSGLLALDDKVVGFFGPEDLPDPVSENLGAMTIRHLLTMGTGHATGLSGGEWRRIRTSWVREFFKEPVAEPPGTRFIYSSATSYMLSAIVQKVTGQTLHDYMRPRFLEPLGIGPIEWDTCPNGINSGGNGISSTTADLVKFAAVHLNRGVWNGRRLLSEEWVDMATRPAFTNVALGSFDGRRYQAPSDDPTNPNRREGYGYQWWIGPGDSYYAAGLFGQYAIVLPSQDAVLAFTAAVQSAHVRLLRLAWDILVPAMGDAPLPEDAAAGAALSDRLAGLRLLPEQPWAPAPPVAAEVSGRPFAVEPTEDQVTAVEFTFAGDECRFAMTDHRGRHEVAVGLRQPIESDTTVTGNLLHHQYQPDRMRVVASGHWEAGNVFRMVWVFVDTAFRDELVCRFTGDAVTIDRSVNVNSSALVRPTLNGRLSRS